MAAAGRLPCEPASKTAPKAAKASSKVQALVRRQRLRRPGVSLAPKLFPS
jgi:hypothetical protein